MISAKLFGFKEEPYFKAEEGASQPPTDQLEQSAESSRSRRIIKTARAAHRAVIARFAARFEAAGLFILKEVD